MKKFWFIELSDPKDDTKPAGFTRRGMIVVAIILAVLIILTYIFLERTNDPEEMSIQLPWLVVSTVFGIPVVLTLAYVVQKFVRKHSEKISALLSNTPSKEIRFTSRFAKVSILVSVLLSSTSDPFTSLIASLLLLSSVFMLFLKNWARVLFIVVASIIILLNLLSFLSVDALIEQGAKIVAGTGWNSTYILLVALTVKILLTGYLVFGIFFLCKPNIKTLFQKKL